jgi:glutaredoxin-like YruB-family protein
MSEQIEVFTTPTCPYCTKIKEWLEENGYDYQEHNVAENKEKAKEMIEKTGQRGVPQTFIGDKAVIGFQPQEIEKALE